MIKFGPAGNSDSFYEAGYKTTLDVPGWLSGRGLNAYEYQCTRGVRITSAFADALRVQAERWGISLSIHAPYYINLASEDPQIIDNSRKHLRKSLQAANQMGATRVVFHPGAQSKMPRQQAMANLMHNLEQFVEETPEELYRDCFICPETMGRASYLGTLPEILEICKIHPRIRPAVDFGHIHALEGGSLNNEAQFNRVIEKIAKALGTEGIQNLHVHFSPVEFTAGGEKKHCNLRDKEFGPDFYPLAKVLLKKKMTPTIICESAGCQAEDALSFQSIYRSLEKESSAE